MTYVWINPVVDSMYEQSALESFLTQHGYKRFYTTRDWAEVVGEKYRMAVEQSEKPVLDVRCPKMPELFKETVDVEKVTIPDIKPILIHCSEEVSTQEDLLEEEKIITTPCQALADMGNALGLKNTYFLPWNRFIEKLGGEPMRILPEKSPIPPGFFDELGIKTESVTGEDEIRNYLRKGVPKDTQLVEMLFCREGCHNGDGIRKVE